jgi:hypothetical protein
MYNIYTAEGIIKVQTGMLTAVYATKFPEVLQTWRELFENMFKAMKEVRMTARILAYLTNHVSMILLRLDKINREILMLRDKDYHISSVGLALSSISAFFDTISESFYDHFKNQMTYKADLGS